VSVSVGAVDAGPLARAAELEAFARLVIALALDQGRRPFFYLLRGPAELAGTRHP
jgi:predicted dinucleotide-binding enzyme